MSLFRARNKRRREEMRELGLVMSHAFHDPEGLEALLKPPVEEALNSSVNDPGAWEQDAWWSSRPTP